MVKELSKLKGLEKKIKKITESKLKKQKILGKPKAKITAVDIKKILLKGETGERRLVTEEAPVREFQESRSLFFKQEFARETMGVNKWLS